MHLRWFNLPLLSGPMYLHGAILEKPLTSSHAGKLSSARFSHTPTAVGDGPPTQAAKPADAAVSHAIEAHLSHLAPGSSLERIHFALAVAQAVQAAPHFAVGSLGRSGVLFTSSASALSMAMSLM